MENNTNQISKEDLSDSEVDYDVSSIIESKKDVSLKKIAIVVLISLSEGI